MKNGKKIECAGFAWVLQGGGGIFQELRSTRQRQLADI